MPEGQPAFPYSEEQLQILNTFISQERLRMYVAMNRNVIDPGLRLRRGIRNYELNTRLSEALYPVVQGFEITFRNAIHNRLVADQTVEWYDTFPFLGPEQESIARAKQTIAEKPNALTPDRVVAELSFGFWVKLFSSDYEATLWQSSLRHLVPVNVTRGAAYSRFKDLKTLRNRIAHHNRIMGRPLTVRQSYDQLLDTIGWIDQTMRSWIEATNRVLDCLPKPIANRPIAPPSSNLGSDTPVS